MRQGKNRHISGKRAIVLIVTALMFAFIFVQSLLPQGVSANESAWLTDRILNPLLKTFGIGPISHRTVRKIAHVLEFAVLSFMLTICFRGRIVNSIGIGFSAAFLDESLQLLSGRGASIADVWIDLIGVAAGSAFGFLLWIVFRRLRSEKE